MAVIMKGLEVANGMKEGLMQEASALKDSGIIPCLGIVRVGSKPDDLAYERGAVKRCSAIGIEVRIFEYDEEISQPDFLQELKEINENSAIHGILLFRPLPRQLDENVVKFSISPEKDMDCFHPVNVAKVFEGDTGGFPPCTPEAVIEMLDHYQIPIEGKKVVVIGRSMVVGKPVSMLLVKRHGTVTICHTRTRNIEEICRGAEILVAAAGKAKMVTDAFVSPGTVVVDVGINVDEAGNLCGDVDFEKVEGIAQTISPVPGGVGTVTTSMLARHVIQAAQKAANK